MDERAVRVGWLQTRSRDQGFFEQPIFHSPQTTCTLHDKATIAKVLEHFALLPLDKE